MAYVGGRLTSLLSGITWPLAFVVLLVLYVLMHYTFVSHSAQILALFRRLPRGWCEDRCSSTVNGRRRSVKVECQGRPRRLGPTHRCSD